MSEPPFIRKPKRGLFNVKERDSKVIEELAIVTQVGLTMAGSIGLCFWVGYRLDKWLGTHGILLTLFIILGILGGGWTVYREIKDLDGSGGRRDGSC